MKNPDLVCVGEVLVDFVPVDGGASYEPRLGGAPANLAVIATALGVRTRLLSRVGDDWLGRFIHEQLDTRGIDVQDLRRESRNTGLAVVAPPEQSPPDFLMYREASADAAIELDEAELDLVDRAAIVHLSSLLPTSEAGRAVAEQILTRTSPSALISYDVNLRPTAWASTELMHEWATRLSARADIVKATESEVCTLGLDPAARQDALWLVTDGASGARMICQDWEVRATPPAVTVVDTTGAGDATLASVIASLLAERLEPRTLTSDAALHLLEEAVRLGSEVVQHAGATEWLPNGNVR